MSEYIFGKYNLAQRAAENIEKYRTNRSELVSAHIEAIKHDIEQKVLEVSRSTGQSSMEYNISKFPLPNDHPKIAITPLDSSNELEKIIDNVVAWCEKEGLKVDIPGRMYNSVYYKTNMRISWHEPSSTTDSEQKNAKKTDSKTQKEQVGLVQIR